jgi:3'-5' exoribonuclease
MPRRFLNQLGEREAIKDTFLLGDKQLRHNRNGNLYLQMRLSDKTATVNAMLWNAKQDTAADVANGDYVQIEGTTQLFNGALQIIVTKITKAVGSEINEEDYQQISPAQVESFQMQLSDMLEEIADEDLRELAKQFLSDPSFMAKFCRAPAAVKNHHAHHGGLLAHVVQLMRLAQVVVELYPNVDQDLVLMGAFLHDVGKIDELYYERDLGYTDEGQLIGHLVMGVSILERKIDETVARTGKPFPEDLALRLKHMIVSHHGKLEFGSPKVPMTAEAFILHYLDDLDAKLASLQQIVSADANAGSAWTPFHPGMGRKIFKSRKTN